MVLLNGKTNIHPCKLKHPSVL